MKCAIYVRVSTEEQNADNQVKICQEYCSRQNIEVSKVYADTGYSGKLTSRPAFDEMLKDMRSMRFNCVMVTKLDRMGRSLQHILSLFEEFKNKGIHFIAVTQNIDTSSSIGKFQLQMLGAFAEFERNIISERTREGLKFATGTGKRGVDKNPRKKRGVLRHPLPLIEK
jgi:DNA invertase Pin-like site-specific DNA recombinase